VFCALLLDYNYLGLPRITRIYTKNISICFLMTEISANC
jgi:hypothetical protein